MAIDSTYGKNYLATQFGTKFAFGAVFTTAPTGGNPGTEPSTPYVRKALTWGAPSNGVITATATFDVPATTIKGTGVFDAVTAGNYGSGKLESDVVFTGPDTVTVTYTLTIV